MLRRAWSTRVTAMTCVALLVGMSFPGLSSADPVTTPQRSIARTAQVLAAREVLASRGTAAAQSQGAAAHPELESSSFFKTKVGVAVLAAFGAGVGYAIYSASNDRIKSPGR